MKTKFTLSTVIIFVMLLLGSGFITSCTKEGPQGIPGLNGEDGIDGAQSCGACHNMTEFLKAKIEQYGHSVHSTGANTNRSDAACARCHTSMGFRNFITDSTMVVIENPTPINCRTCHPIHETFSTDDFLPRTVDSVQLMLGGVVYNYGKSNLCVNCHQARPLDPMPDLNSTEPYKITNIHYGPHHGPQANMITAVGPVKIPGSMPYLNSAHYRLVTNGCVTCHMSPATGVLGGGHQMGVKYKTQSGADAYQFTGCYAADCHGTAAEITGLITPNRAEITELLEELSALLLEKGLIGTNGLAIAPNSVSQLEAAVMLNFYFAEEDRSHGAHNFRFTKALLVNSIEALK